MCEVMLHKAFLCASGFVLEEYGTLWDMRRQTGLMFTPLGQLT